MCSDLVTFRKISAAYSSGASFIPYMYCMQSATKARCYRDALGRAHRERVEPREDPQRLVDRPVVVHRRHAPCEDAVGGVGSRRDLRGARVPQLREHRFLAKAGCPVRQVVARRLALGALHHLDGPLEHRLLPRVVLAEPQGVSVQLQLELAEPLHALPNGRVDRTDEAVRGGAVLRGDPHLPPGQRGGEAAKAAGPVGVEYFLGGAVGH
uniref:Uncharacterized protein n=1 Tax=Tetraselmis sp. GSL018 TaxID=582737 RepID=A0A061RN38_9CHLO